MLKTGSNQNLFLANGCANSMSYTNWTSTAQMGLLWVSGQNQGLKTSQKPQDFILITLVPRARAVSWLWDRGEKAGPHLQFLGGCAEKPVFQLAHFSSVVHGP